MNSNVISRRVKTLLIPLFVVFTFSAIGFYSFSLLQSDEAGLNEFNTGILEKRTRILDFQFIVQDTITNLYQMTATASTETDKNKLKDLQQKGLQAINQLDANYRDIQATMASVGIAEEKTNSFALLMSTYIQASRNVINMVDTDAATAMAWVTPAQSRFSELDQLLNDVSQQLAVQKQSRLHELTSDMEKGRNIFIVITLLVSLLTVALAFILSKFMAALETLHASTNAMLESLGQGLFFFDAEGICAPIYSKACLDLLECNPARKNIADVFKLTPENRDLFRTVLEMLFTGKMAMGFDELAALAPPTYAHSGGLHIGLAYRPITNQEGILKNVLVVATDRTKEKMAEKKLIETEVAAQRTIRIARGRNYFIHFIRNFEDCIMTPTAANPDSVEQVRRDIHTLKGTATMFQFVELAHALHNLEIAMPKDMRDPELAISKHRQKLLSLFEKSKAYAREILGDDFQSSGQIRAIPEHRLYAFAERLQRDSSAGAAIQQLCIAYCQDVLAIPIWQLMDNFAITLQELADRMGKPLNSCVFSGENFPVLPEVYEPLLGSFVHIARNIVDHGIETANLRNQRAKNPKATITIRTESFKKGDQDWFSIEFGDDGGGIDVTLLRKKLLINTPPSKLDGVDDHAVIQHLFDAKISTREHVTLVSGRGIGLNVVKAETIKLGGSVEIFSNPGLGVRLRVEVPFTHTLQQKRSGGKAV